jgi:hypothetical protein
MDVITITVTFHTSVNWDRRYKQASGIAAWVPRRC